LVCAPFIINITGQCSDTVSGYQLGFAFDPTYFEISAVNKGDLPSFTVDNFGLNELNLGKLRTIWVDERMENITDSLGTKRLFDIYAKALRPICNINNVFAIDNSVLASNFYKFNGKPVEALLSWDIVQEEIKYFLTNVYPNPVTNNLAFSFELLEPTDVNIIVQDYYGHSIIHSDTYLQGAFDFSFTNLSSLQGNLLSYTATLGNRVYAGSIVKF
jgi:hypothetical protein